jgi:putative flippase GtrA
VTRRSLGLLARHQTGALFASAVDFLMMIAWVELRLGTSVSGAAVGAASGAFTNFMLGRRWIFQAGNRSAAGQAFRYFLVSAGSLGLNSLGQYIALRLIGLPYVLCRVIVAVLVGVCWNFPLHRRFVFAGGGRDRTPDVRATP